ncbi:Protein CBG17198 [Caenorhabditis briggsae]|uniref:Protein CBG17198 n=2 Tax=Caenorhabditis briggsae TaxID=6238 RepID=A8XQK8_CAEBR|nr:Protein CBG17198 [Caenorhabditis briggsae]ULT81369.1 hypothetical protein L3Y34_011333 [Caenorhabditis briggsae]CAP34933.2 Protein CBG17198 [Caenorhabditis briggsae]
MGAHMWPGAKTRISEFFNNNHVNQIVTFLIIAAGLYVSMVSITGQNFLHPLLPVTSNTLNLQNAANEILHSIISCFMMIVLAVAAGKLVKFVYIPSLIGCMLVGIAMRNVPQFGELFYINEYWQFILRKLSLVVIIIRWGISINVRFIKKNYIFPPILGIGSAFCEAIAICFTACVFFNFPISLGIICGFVVATVSPAVGMPTMLRLKEQGIGTTKNIPDVVPAACCFDNFTSLLIFSVTSSVTYTHDAVFATMVKSIGAIVLAAIIGCVIGWLLRWFPKNDNRHTHFARFLVIASSTYAVITSMLVLGYPFPGIVAGLCLCCVSTTQWREDNPKGIKVLVHQYDNLWYFVAVPLLFSLVGYTFDFDQLSASDWKTAFVLIAVGCSFRLISAMILSFCGHFNIYEQLILALTLMPKATVQCALAPSLILMTAGFPELREQTKLIVYICIIAVMVTSPVVEILLDILGPRILRIKEGTSLYNRDITNSTILDEVDSKQNLQIIKSSSNNTTLNNRVIYELNPNFVPINISENGYPKPHYQYFNNTNTYRNGMRN